MEYIEFNAVNADAFQQFAPKKTSKAWIIILIIGMALALLGVWWYKTQVQHEQPS